MVGRGKDYIPIGNNKVISIDPLTLSITHTYTAGVRGNHTDDYILSAVSGASCPAPMTRAALITLRNASGLVKDCDYVITDHVQGRLVAGTEIHLQAVSANELSENVSVNTTYDNEAWAGIYDLDRALVLELHDNRGNIARGINGTEVANFDWGNTFYTDNLVDNATWTGTIGAARTVTGCEFKNGSIVTTTGQTGGSILRTIVDNTSSLTTTNANVSIVNMRLENQSTAQLTGFVAGATLTNWTLDNGTINFSGSTSNVSLSNVRIFSSTINHINVTSGTITGSSLFLENISNIFHNNGAGNLSLNRVRISNNSTVTHSLGTIALADYEMLDNSAIQQTGTGNVSLSGGQIFGGVNIINQGAYIMTGTRFNATSGAAINFNAAAIGVATLTGTRFSEAAQLNVTATSTAGNVTITNSHVGTTSLLTKSGTGVMTISNTDILSNSRVTVSNTRGISIGGGQFTNLTQINQSGTGTVTDVLTDCYGDTRGVYNLSSSGAAAHNLSYCKVSGFGANLNISGTSSGQSISRVKADASTYNFASNVANTYTNMSLVDGTTCTFQNMTVAKNFNNVQGRNGSFITVTNPTGAGAIQNVLADNAGTINITGTAGVGSTITARDSGTITFDGGSANRVTKQMIGTLTTGAFTHTNVVMINPVSQVLTANNTGRSSYLGVVSSVPLI